VPLIRSRNHDPRLTSAGCSFGGYHAANVALRHPDIFTGMLSMSGAFDLSSFLGGYYDQDCHRNLLTHHLANLIDPWLLNRYRRNSYILASGWDDHCLAQNQNLDRIMSAKDIVHKLSGIRGIPTAGPHGGACLRSTFKGSCQLSVVSCQTVSTQTKQPAPLTPLTRRNRNIQHARFVFNEKMNLRSPMTALNPYANFLDGRPVKDILTATPSTLAGLIESIGPARIAASPAPGKWSPAEIVCHLADCELAFAFRLRQTLAETNHVIQPFDQEKWALTYPGTSANQALDVFTLLRGWNLQLMRTVLPQAATKPVTHPERGAMTFQTIIETMAGHDLNHLAQLHKLAAATPSK
jgi:hypothetical protein